MVLFDHNKIQQNISRAQKQYSDEDRFLYRWAEEQINDRLKDIKRKFKNTLTISDFALRKPLKTQNKAPYDCAISLFNLHRQEHPHEQIKAIKNQLQDDGLFLGIFFGGDTLKELKQTLINTEINLSGGSHQRTTPMMTKQQVGAFMQSSGYALPVIDSETVTVEYKQLTSLFRDLRAMGETNILSDRSRTFPPKLFFAELEKYYKETFSENDKYIATYEIIFCAGWTPDESQQKPLRPGSGKTSLKDVL